MLTLPHESIANSPKSYFVLDQIQALARRKYNAGALLSDPVDEAMLNATVWKKVNDNGRRNKGNWSVLPEWQVPGSRLYQAMEMMKAKLALGLYLTGIVAHFACFRKDSKTANATGQSS